MPHTPCTTDMLLQYSDTFGPRIAHNHLMEDVIFECDRTWYSLVVTVPMPKKACDNEEIEESMLEEIQRWNPSRAAGIKAVWILLRQGTLWNTKGSLMISYDRKEVYEEVRHEGWYINGERCRISPYKP
jgi:hypothetical protein